MLRLAKSLALLPLVLLMSTFLVAADGDCGGVADDDDDDDSGEGEGEAGEGEGEPGEGEGEGEPGEGEGEPGEGEGEPGEGEGEGEPGEGEGEGEGETCPGLPPASAPCLEGQCGNAQGVGQPCSDGGGECNDFFGVDGGAFFCTVDFVADAPLAMCTRPCGEDADCGDGAVCIGDPEDPDSDKGCVPTACAEEG